MTNHRQVVIQCRCRDVDYVPSGDEVDQACQQIDTWGYPIHSCILAHSGAKCSRIERYVAGMSEQRIARGACEIRVYAWEDLISIAEQHPEILRTYFPALLIPIPVAPTIIERIVQSEGPHTLRMSRHKLDPILIFGRRLTSSRMICYGAAIGCISVVMVCFQTRTPTGLASAVLMGAIGFLMMIIGMLLAAESRRPLMIATNRLLEADRQGGIYLTTLTATCWCGGTADIRRAQVEHRTEQILCCRSNPQHPLHRALFDHTLLGSVDVAKAELAIEPPGRVS
jgi:hypothetical protein